MGNCLDQIHIVLSHPSHPGNIGGAARAMKNMGLSKLRLVVPKQFPHVDATQRASGADDILAGAEVYADLQSALHDCQLVYGTSARERHLQHTLCSAQECAERILAEPNKKIAIVFGNERSGLSNEELALCHFHVNIPTVDGFSSLNLAAAVQVIVYELFKQASGTDGIASSGVEEDEVASFEKLQGFYDHLQQSMMQVGFLDAKQPRLLMQRLHRLFNRAQLTEKEINILRGFLSAAQKRIDANEES